ncbi:c-type cytochrome [Pontibacter ramchanderi]|uniref:Thiosulfate dehydrogenase n=1 Tax=Pontibacter ramchanderi TaxID=1179743 RepID=A0A2N3V0H8_9BACT|nr:c-type cytochrome [Pontibacter ramchanderi]PKV75150.1 thiosulfate dehydrogenase [Pontibacter ramchanderi]
MNLNQENEVISFLLRMSNVVALSAVAVLFLLGLVMFLEITGAKISLPVLTEVNLPSSAPVSPAPESEEAMWQAPQLASLPATPEGDQIRYGRELVAHTAQYLGPEGSVLQIANGMNCQNCHLDAGTKPFGNNYALVAATYPKFRARSGTEEDQVKRVSDCFERSLNGTAPEPGSNEMQAMVAYINWVGQNVAAGESPKGAGLVEIAYLDRAASPVQGKALYVQKCQVCHGDQGQGLKPEGSSEYVYPPLWGADSYNDGAGLYRVSTFARYVKANMPLGATYGNPMLTDEEAWDLAAFVNSMPRPKKDISQDWPDISKKPMDHPFGPYTDQFSEEQHKYGPFKPILAASKK